MKDSLAAAPTSNDYDAAKLAWEEILTSEKDAKWVEAQKAKVEKFGMYLLAVRAGLVGLVEAEKAAKEGKTGVEEAKALITANHDAICLWLDKKVGTDVCFREAS
jgi:cysteinyl-tRNA synthetase